LQKVM